MNQNLKDIIRTVMWKSKREIKQSKRRHRILRKYQAQPSRRQHAYFLGRPQSDGDGGDNDHDDHDDDDGGRGEICHCRQCRRQCKIFASSVNISIFTQFLVFLSLKLLKFGEIKVVKLLAWKSGGVKFLTNLMSGWWCSTCVLSRMLSDRSLSLPSIISESAPEKVFSGSKSVTAAPD